MKMERNRQNKGITLIALIITIIVMLILAGVSIGALTDDEGIFSQARNAVNSYENAQERENQSLEDYAQFLNQALSDQGIVGGGGTTPPPTTESISTTTAGDYIKYPEIEGYSGNWVVLKNEGGVIEIVPTEIPKSIELGGNNFETAKISWENAVKILNEESRKYANSSLAVSARVLGSASASAETVTIPGTPFGTYSAADYTAWVGAYEDTVASSPYTDELYKTDEPLIKSLIDTNVANYDGNVWLGSRRVSISSSSFFHVRYLNSSGSVSSNDLFNWRTSGSAYGDSISYGLIPVVTLKSTINITGGSGTSSSPYEISN